MSTLLPKNRQANRAAKRFEIWKFYEGPPLTTPWGTTVTEGDRCLHDTVEQYDDELTARVRVAILNEGLAKKKYFLAEQVEEGSWVEVDDD
jgi:hypothetical protein